MTEPFRFVARDESLARPLGLDRRRPLYGALRLRPPRSDHTRSDLALIAEAAGGVRQAVEVGVAEGVSAGVIRAAMHPEGRLTLVDPFATGRFGFSPLRVVARRVVRAAGGGPTTWIRSYGLEAAGPQLAGIELINLDGVNDFAALVTEVDAWSSLMAPAGRAVVRTEARAPAGHPLASASVPEVLAAGGRWSPEQTGDGIVVLRATGAA